MNSTATSSALTYSGHVAFLPGMKVVAANDHGPNPRVGEVVRLLRREEIAGLNEGVFDVIEVYLVRWPTSDGQFVEAEAPGVNLRALPARPR